MYGDKETHTWLKKKDAHAHLYIHLKNPQEKKKKEKRKQTIVHTDIEYLFTKPLQNVTQGQFLSTVFLLVFIASFTYIYIYIYTQTFSPDEDFALAWNFFSLMIIFFFSYLK